MRYSFVGLLLIIMFLPFQLCAQKLSVKKAGNGKYGYYDKDGKCVIAPVYDFALGFNNDTQMLDIVRKDAKYTFIDRENHIVFDEWFDNATSFVDRMAVVTQAGKSWIIDYMGKRISPVYASVKAYRRDGQLVGFCVEDTLDKKFAFVDASFHKVFGGDYEQLYPYVFKGVTVFIVKKNARWGTVNLKGESVVPCIYESLQANNAESPLSYKIGYNKFRKMNIKTDDLQFLEVSDGTKHGVISFLGEELLPLKYSSSYDLRYKGMPKNFKKLIKPYIDSMVADGYADVQARYLASSTQELMTQNTLILNQLPIEIRKPEKVNYAKNKQGYYYLYYVTSKKKVNTALYQSLEKLKGNYLVMKNGLYGVIDLTGKTVIPCDYEKLEVWGDDGNGGVLLLATQKNKKGILSEYGIMCTPLQYDEIYFPIGGYGLALSGDKKKLVNSRGRVVGKRMYDQIDNYTTPGSPIGWLAGYASELDQNGDEKNNILQQIFKKAYDLPDSEAQQKYDLFCLCMKLDQQDGVAGASACNIGVLYANMGNEDEALKYYDKAARLGNSQGRKNAKSIRTNRTLNKIQQIGAALTQVAQGVTGVQNGTFQQNINMDAGGDLYTATGTGLYGENDKKGGGNAAFYNSNYQRWERRAESVYNSLTLLGTKVKDKNGNRSGSTNASWNSANYTSLKRNLREAQREMQKTRTEARRNGVTIQQSKWETATVSY